ncbi:MAG: hypothetical protein J6Z35_04950 [Lachnospiraceae bacterium]|nr:hypothetical protein [Lachnospiraceae bacterium]
MEYVYFGIGIFCFFAFVIVRDIISDKRKQKLFEKKLREEYGNIHEREYSPERFVRIDRYLLKHQEMNCIDDITWNDLGMDEIFKSMNETYSAAGEEYLYYLLHNAGDSVKQVEAFGRMAAYFGSHEKERVALQICTAGLGYMGKYSLYDYIDNLDYLGERSNKKDYLVLCLYVILCLFLPFQFAWAIMGIVALMIYNIMSYFKEKEMIEPYIISFKYILKLINCSEKISKMQNLRSEREFSEIIEMMDQAVKKLLPVKRGSGIVVSGSNSTGGDPIGMIFDYIKMAFHVDLIQFNKMLRNVRENTDAVDALSTGIGRLESAVAVSAWRKYLENHCGYTIPEIWESCHAEDKENKGLNAFELKEAYHPLLKEPVKNSITTKSGVLLTGSNASGKSTFLKTVALNAILAQTVLTCTAELYRAPMMRIYSSMSLRDDLESGDSYYIVEIKALKRILTAADEDGRPVLCFVDEVLRGTNTVERIAASTQILRSLHRKNIFCFAATHDIELTDLLADCYDNYHFEEEIADGDIYFPYRLLNGKATTRNAIRLLELIGYDRKIVDAAEKMAGNFMTEGVWS